MSALWMYYLENRDSGTCSVIHVHVQLKAIIACECYNQILSKKDEINWFFMQHLNSFKVGFDLSGRSEEFHSWTGLILNVPLSCGVSLQGGPKHWAFLICSITVISSLEVFREKGLRDMLSHTCT